MLMHNMTSVQIMDKIQTQNTKIDVILYPSSSFFSYGLLLCAKAIVCKKISVCVFYLLVIFVCSDDISIF